MNGSSNNKDFDRIRTQMECVDETASELIEASRGKSHSSQPDESFSQKPELADLVDWLNASNENQKQLDELQKLNDSIRDAVREVPALDPSWTERIKAQIAESGAAPSAEVQIDLDPTESAPDNESYQELFDETDRLAALNNSSTQSDASTDLAKSESGSMPVDPVSTRRSFGQWWIGAMATVGTVAATIALVVLLNPEQQDGKVDYSPEMLCAESLTWNPNKAPASWSADLSLAPQERFFPNHLIRLQARSWKRMEIDGDQDGVVYNLIPDGHLSELKAYVYVFKAGKDYQLPNQFDSHATSNRRYKFWSVACQQDLVFVLVYEGDEKRLQDLIKEQQVG